MKNKKVINNKRGMIIKNDSLDKISILISIAFFVVLGVYIFLLYNFRPLIGDDFNYYYYKKVSGYVDSDLSSSLEYQTKIGIPFSERLKIFKNSYTSFSGRIMSMIFSLLFSWINNRTLFAVLAVFVYLLVVILSARLVYRNSCQVMKHPLSLIIFGAFLLLYNEGVGNIYTFTILFHYGISYLLWLILLNFALDRAYTSQYLSRKKLLAINLLGIFAGITHELIGAFSLIFIAALSIGTKGFKEGIKEVKYYIGAFIGFLFCFFAPGNFARVGTDHDAAIFDPYYIKLLRSLKQHVATFIKMKEAGTWLLIFGIILVIVHIILKIKKREKISWKKAIFWQCFVILSVFLWAMVSYVPKYGLLLAMVMQIVAIYRLFYDSDTKEVSAKEVCAKEVSASEAGAAGAGEAGAGEAGADEAGTNETDANETDMKRVLTTIVSFIFLFAIIINLRWVPVMVQETEYRLQLVAKAAEEGLPEVIVPSYSDAVTCHDVMVPNNLNNSDFYRGKKVSQLYYGTKIIIEGQNQ